jgi:hypothetical protein
VIYVYSAIALAITLGFVCGFIALVNKLAGGARGHAIEEHDDQRSQKRRC